MHYLASHRLVPPPVSATGRKLLANMPLLTALLTAALTSAETPKYCGRARSGVDELRAPQTEASLRSVQVVARHGARAPVADCGRWLPAASLLVYR